MREFIVELVAADTYVFIAAGSNVAHMIQEVSKDATVIVASLEVLESAGVTGTIPRPQGNVTGLSTLGAELITKRLTFLREVIPGLRKVVAVAHPRNRNHPPLIAAFCQSAARLEIETIAGGVSGPRTSSRRSPTPSPEGLALRCSFATSLSRRTARRWSRPPSPQTCCRPPMNRPSSTSVD